MMKMNLQFFAEPGEGTEGGDGNGTQQNSQGAGTTPEIDYEKLASIVAGRQSAAEDSVLKNYFKQQGLSQEEATKAISDVIR